MEKITVREARKKDAAAAQWTIRQTPDGWIVWRNEATLVSEHSRQARLFKDLNRAIVRLREEIGIRSFKLEMMQQ